MLTTKRHQKILSLLKKQQTASIHELSKETGASISTIRRDLEQLEREDKLKRVHGGASYIHPNRHEPELEEKQGLNEKAKGKIGQKAASFVDDGDCVFLDAGTTTKKIIPFLEQKNVIVVTNAYHFVERLLKTGTTTYLTGGLAKLKTGALIGVQAEDTIKAYHFDKCFIGSNGIHTVHGYTTPDPEEARIKRLAIKRSREAYVLGDESKFQDVSFSQIADIASAAIITDLQDESIISNLRKKTIVNVVSKE